MPSSVLFSIVVPTYNREKFIYSTIGSLLKQRYGDFEIIVVDDGSTDQTESVVRSIADARVRYYRKENGERGAARNFGALQAKGDYINFFDSDDIAYPDHLNLAFNKISMHGNMEIFHFAYDVVDEQGNTLHTKRAGEQTINNSLINGNHLSCDCVFVRRDIALQFPFNEDRRLSASEDYELWLRIAARFPFRSFAEVTTAIVNHDERSVITSRGSALRQRINSLQEYLMADQQFVSYYHRDLPVFKAYLNIYLALHLGISGEKFSAGQAYLMKAARIYPPVIFTRRFVAAVRALLF